MSREVSCKKTGNRGTAECGYCEFYKRIVDDWQPYAIGHCTARAPARKGFPRVLWGESCGQFKPVSRVEGERRRLTVYRIGPTK